MSITVNRFPASSPDQDDFICQNLDPLFGVEVKPLSTQSSPPLPTDPDNILSIEGLVVLTQSTAGAFLLPVPKAGLPSVGGSDGRRLAILNQSGHAHTVVTPTNGINGVYKTITFSATAGTRIELWAYNGVWYVNPTVSGVYALS